MLIQFQSIHQKTFFKLQTDEQKLTGKCKGTRVLKITLKKKNQSCGVTLPNFKTYKTAIIKPVWYWDKVRQIYQWSRREFRNRCMNI